MKIMESWMKLDGLEGENTRRYFIESSGKRDTKKFTYRKPFGIHFRYIHQLDDHNNNRHAPIYLDRTWTTNFWLDHNFA